MRSGKWIVAGMVFAAGLMMAAWGPRLRAEPARESSKDLSREGSTEGGAGVNVGDPCTVYLRGDAAGAIIHDRVADLSLLIARHGTFEGMDSRWVLLRDGARRYEIPVSSIMLIEYSGKGDASDKPADHDGPRRPGLDLR